MELLGLIEQVDTADIDPTTQLSLAQLQGEILALLGRHDEAEVLLQTALERAEKNADVLVQAELLSSLADVSRKQGDSDLSLQRHKKAGTNGWGSPNSGKQDILGTREPGNT